MPVDSSIYFNQQTPDFLGSYEKGLDLRQKLDERKQQQDALGRQRASEDAFKSSTIKNPDGSVEVDKAKTLQTLAGIGPKEYQQGQEYFQKQDALKRERANQEIDFVTRRADSVTDQASWDAFLNEAHKSGLDFSSAPRAYDKQFLDHAKLAYFSAKDQRDQKNKEIDQDYEGRRVAAQEKTANDSHADRLEKMKDSAGNKQDDAYQKATKDLNTYRGNNAVQQAASALTNAKNALDLANKGNLSPDQIHLFASEMGKLATNGVPGQSEIDALVPNTAKTKLAKVVSFFSNNPTDADAQAFINNNKPYLNDLINNYGNVVDTYKQNIIDGYKKKLKPEDLSDLKKRYAPGQNQAQIAATGPGGKPQSVIQNGHTYILNPQTGQYE